MSGNNVKEKYLNFDEYIRQGDPQKKERAEAWRVAIGLQAVDGLKVSGYLLELVRRNIEGEISMEELNKLLDEYYEEKHRIRDTWREYETYTKIDVHPDPEGCKRGRPI
ncbi:antitoxin VbhA family protein [Segatella bryantii]|uniref:antitoxin VbhA family protein n=1 Tax=Segatella bryantii TaxID=77095 RepID=UPI001EDBCED5|nr:antitoxin VbhA family protein [Segatella bryantii]UKK75392.1 antitoxin VbhA family protein [Segatella bryantii]